MDQDAADVVIPSSSEEWRRWIDIEEERRRKVYLTDPDELISAFRREREIAYEYEGREILELLQNANDAGAESSTRSRVRIELTRTGLIVANTGLPFTIGGVKSLRLTNLSPKRGRKQLIGNKGLGFRAVLNWSSSPLILSGHLSLAYGEAVAHFHQQELCGASPELQKAVNKEQRHGESRVVPLLAFPLFLDLTTLDSRLLNEVQKGLLQRCSKLIGSYDTVIAMPFENEHVHSRAHDQLQQLRPEILLFTHNLAEIVLNNNSEPIKWMRVDDDGLTTIRKGDEPDRYWRIY